MATDKKTNRELRRREFLKFTALTLAAVGGGSLAACAPAAPAPTAAPPKPAAPAPTTAPAAPAATAAPKPAAPAPTVAAAKPSAPIKTISMSSINNLNAAPQFVGVEKGIWFNHGLDVQLKVFTTGNEMVKAVASKDTFITTSASSNYIPALDQGLELLAIGTGVGDPTRKFGDDHLSITARKDSGIKTIADLAGKKVAYNGAGTTDEYIRAVAAKYNVPIDKITLVNLPPGNTPGALQVGQVDAAVLQEPHGTMVVETIPGAYEVLRGGGILSYFGWMITRPEVIKDEADTLQRFLDGWAEAMQYTRQHPDEAAEISLHWIQGLQANIAKKSVRYISFDPRLSKNMIDSAEDHRKLLVEQKKIKGSLDFLKYVNTRFIEKTLATYPQYFSDLKPTELYRSP